MVAVARVVYKCADGKARRRGLAVKLLGCVNLGQVGGNDLDSAAIFPLQLRFDSAELALIPGNANKILIMLGADTRKL